MKKKSPLMDLKSIRKTLLVYEYIYIFILIKYQLKMLITTQIVPQMYSNFHINTY